MSAAAALGGPFTGPALLFCPADRPDRFAKAAAAADMVILDLEDGVAGNKAAARKALSETLLDPSRTIVRINPVDSSELAADLQVLATTGFSKVMVPKVESAAGLQVLDAQGPLEVMAILETPKGILNAREIAGCSLVSAVMWGAEDLTAALGGIASRHTDGVYTDVVRTARSLVLLAAAEHGKVAVDSVFLDLKDLDGLRRECDDAVRSGFAVKACVHPSQVRVVRDAFATDPATVAWAEQVVTLAETSAGVFQYDGRMIDEPLLRQARIILSRQS